MLLAFRRKGVVDLMMVDNEVAAALMMMPVPVLAHLMAIDCWGLDENGVASLYLGPSRPLLESRDLGRVVAN